MQQLAESARELGQAARTTIWVSPQVTLHYPLETFPKLISCSIGLIIEYVEVIIHGCLLNRPNQV